MTGPPPGSSPTAKPSPLPRSIGAQDAPSPRASATCPETALHAHAARRLLHIRQYLGDAEQADDDGEQVDPGGQFHRAEGEAELAVTTSMPIAASAAPRPIITTPFSAEPWIIRIVQTRPSAISAAYSGGPRRTAKSLERRRREAQHDDAERAGDEGAHRRDAERRAGTPLLRHRVAIEAGDDGGRLARDVHQDGGDRAAIHRAVEDRAEHRHRGDRRQRDRGRQQQRQRGERPDARQHADERADQAADEDELDGLPGKDHLEPGQQPGNRVHRLRTRRGRAATACRAHSEEQVDEAAAVPPDHAAISHEASGATTRNSRASRPRRKSRSRDRARPRSCRRSPRPTRPTRRAAPGAGQNCGTMSSPGAWPPPASACRAEARAAARMSTPRAGGTGPNPDRPGRPTRARRIPAQHDAEQDPE